MFPKAGNGKSFFDFWNQSVHTGVLAMPAKPASA
jgi:hypothetical protein